MQQMIRLVTRARTLDADSRNAGLATRATCRNGAFSPRWLVPLVFALAWMTSQAAPMVGQQDAGPAATPLTGPSPQISTGNANLDRLLEAGGAAAQPSAKASAAKGAQENGGVASAPSLRSADLRQMIRADIAAQAQRSDRRGDGAKAVLGLADTVTNGDAAESDPTTRRRWEDAPRNAQEEPRKTGVGAESPVAQAVREAIDFLRAHRVELFAVIGLLLTVVVGIKLYVRRV